MSNAWDKGSTPRWRKIRAFVLSRDNWTCQLCKKKINPHLPPNDPMAPQVHHTLGRAVTGDDPRYLVAAHRKCNLDARIPIRPKKISKW